MEKATLCGLWLVAAIGCKNSSQPARVGKSENADAYVVTEHRVQQTRFGTQEDDYTIDYGRDVLKVKYASSQTSSAKPGDFPGTGLHQHSYDHDPDLSQVPQLGVAIRRCNLSKDVMSDGSPAIAIQPTPEPCMVQLGDTLQYAPEPNGPQLFTYVNFDVVSEELR